MTSKESCGPQAPAYGTVTLLTFLTVESKQAAVDALTNLIDQARDRPGLIDCWLLDTAPTQAAMVTLYPSQSAAHEASAAMRVRLGAALGAHVTGPPQRWAGPVRSAHTEP